MTPHPSSLPSAVLWDMDGTIVDTEPYWMQAEIALVGAFGGHWTEEQGLMLVGNGLIESALLLQEAGVRLTADEIIDDLTDRVRALMGEHGVPFRPGARELLLELRETGVPTALVTMSWRRMAEDVAGIIGFDAFDAIVVGDEVTPHKPHPEPYLRGAAALGVDPASAVAIEDSVTGLRSAVASGAVSIGVPHLVPLDGVGAHELWPTLAGRGWADLSAVFSAHRAPGIRGQGSDDEASEVMA